MTSRSRVALAGALGVVGASLLLPASSTAAEETCRGVPATIVVTEDGPSEGTEGADVIVIEGDDNTEVFDAKGGDDLICVTSPNGSGLFYAGDGDDIVDASAARKQVSVDLGRGADQYVGHGGPDSVDTDYGDAADNKVDTVSTRGGWDRVHSGTAGLPNQDDIDLGGDTDNLLVEGVPRGSFTAGDGRDSLEIWTAGRRTWAFNLRADPDDVTVNDQATGIDGFESYDLTLLDWARLSYLGGAGDDRIDTLSSLHDLGEEAPRGRGPLTANLGAGSDRITVDSYHQGSIMAGPGRDRLVVKNRCMSECGVNRLDVDLKQDSLQLNGLAEVAVLSFADLTLEGFLQSFVWGDNSANTVRVSGCFTEVRGRGGQDRIRVAGEFDCPARGQRVNVSAHGHAGNDDLVARPWNGTGLATTYGGPGSDRCRAPEKWDCER